MEVANHYIHYLTRDVKIHLPKNLNNPFYAEVQNLKDGFERPQYHITRRNSGPTTRIKTGDIIWLFSTLRSPWGILPPSLDAKFVVSKVKKLRDGRIKFYASQKSKWFPLSDASQLIENLWTVDANGKGRKLRLDKNKPLGFYLQSIRQLSESKNIIEWSKTILNSDLEFISYRIIDGSKEAFIKAQSLVAEGKVVFWDRFSLPRRLAERRELVDNRALDKYIFKFLKSASVVWGIESPKYSVPNSYAQKESSLAKKMNKYKSVPVRNSGVKR
jgi:hypothetical protein